MTKLEKDQLRAVKKAVKIAGGPIPVSEYFNITPWAVSKWPRCPGSRVLALEKLCNNEVTRNELRSDVFGNKHTDQQ